MSDVVQGYSSRRARFMPSYLVPNLPLPLDDAAAIDRQSYTVMRLEDIREEQDDDSYRALSKMREDWHARGRAMVLIQWRDDTQGVLCGDPCQQMTDDDLLRVYRNARRARELFCAEGAMA
jgi:hypothetical protein